MKKPKSKRWPRIVVYTTLSTLAIFLIWLNLFSPLMLVRVIGNSMSPTFTNGTWHLGTKYRSDTPLIQGDVIVFKIKNETYIKRIVAISGDEIPICYGVDDGQLYASIVPMEIVWLNLPHEWLLIPTDYIWVEGDSKTSGGSGIIGLVCVQDIIAVLNTSEAPQEFWYTNSVNKKNQTSTITPRK